jgi:hypothetical protein
MNGGGHPSHGPVVSTLTIRSNASQQLLATHRGNISPDIQIRVVTNQTQRTGHPQKVMRCPIVVYKALQFSYPKLLQDF